MDASGVLCYHPDDKKKILIPILLTIVVVTALVFTGKAMGWFDHWFSPHGTSEVSFETDDEKDPSGQEKTTSAEPASMVVIDPLEGIPLARPYAQKLQKALLEAEEIYITTTPYAEETIQICFSQ